jgi:hypothetical protein
MSLEENKAFVQRYVGEPWNKGNIDILDELCGANFNSEGYGAVEALKAAITSYRKFPRPPLLALVWQPARSQKNEQLSTCTWVIPPLQKMVVSQASLTSTWAI